MYCRTCKYELKGLQERCCPECGTAFDPNKPATYLRTRHQRRDEAIHRLVAGSVFILMGVLVLVFLAALLGFLPWFPSP